MRFALRNRALTLCVLSAAVTSLPAAAISPCPIHGEDAPLKRTAHIVAQAHDQSTVAMEWQEGRVADNASFDAACEAAEPDRRAQCLGCLALAAIKAIRVGSPDDHAALFKPKANYERGMGMISYDVDGKAVLYMSMYASCQRLFVV